MTHNRCAQHKWLDSLSTFLYTPYQITGRTNLMSLQEQVDRLAREVEVLRALLDNVIDVNNLYRG